MAISKVGFDFELVFTSPAEEEEEVGTGEEEPAGGETVRTPPASAGGLRV